MDCREVEVLTHGYLDAELPLDQAQALERHLDGCAACARALRRHQALRTALRAQAPRYRAPEALRRGLSAAAPRPAARRSLRLSLPALPALRAAVAFASVALVAGGALLARRAGQEAALAEAAVSAHTRAMTSGRLEDVISTNQHTVKPWFATKVDFSPPVEDAAAEGFPLAGGRLDSVGGERAAVLVYKRRDHVIDLFVWPSSRGPASPRARTLRGFHTLRWTRAGMAHLAVSDLNEPELSQFAGLVRSRE